MRAPPEQLIEAACRTKRQFFSISVAINAAWLGSASGGVRLAVYRCDCCGQFHMTKKLDGSNAVACAIGLQ